MNSNSIEVLLDYPFHVFFGVILDCSSLRAEYSVIY